MVTPVFNNTKKGQGLVEVMVSLTILSFVLIGSMTLVIRSLNLVVSSRSRTEAIAMAQEGITEATARLTASCPTVAAAVGYVPYTTTRDGLTLVVELLAISSADMPSTGNYSTYTTSPENNFYKVQSRVAWRDKGSPVDSDYKIVTLVPKQ